MLNFPISFNECLINLWNIRSSNPAAPRGINKQEIESVQQKLMKSSEKQRLSGIGFQKGLEAGQEVREPERGEKMEKSFETKDKRQISKKKIKKRTCFSFFSEIVTHCFR